MKYLFTASCFGLESLIEFDSSLCKSIQALNMHCLANMHRRQIWGLIDMDADVKEGLLDIMQEDREVALKLIKQSPYEFESGNAKQYQRYMEQIPNKIIGDY